MDLITNEEQLLANIPNIISSVKGERPLIEKMEVFLRLSEMWVISTFVSEKPFETICYYNTSNYTRRTLERLVVADAMLRAIPSLDIVLTPNGFGVVSTQNLAPASKPRVDRLVESMQSHRDDCIAALLKHLPSMSDWLATAQADFFGATLFPATSIVQDVGAVCASKWAKYLELRSQIIDLEASLADEWFSPELMSSLRSENLRSTLTGDRKLVATQIKAQIIGYLRNGSFNSRRLADIVNFIRQRETEFPEWHNSDVAQLFSPPVFRNKKESKGYFF